MNTIFYMLFSIRLQNPVCPFFLHFSTCHVDPDAFEGEPLPYWKAEFSHHPQGLLFHFPLSTKRLSFRGEESVRKLGRGACFHLWHSLVFSTGEEVYCVCVSPSHSVSLRVSSLFFFLFFLCFSLSCCPAALFRPLCLHLSKFVSVALKINFLHYESKL